MIKRIDMLKERAEDYTIEELRRQKLVREDLVYRIKHYIKEPYNSGLFILGKRGYGKTHATLVAIAEAVQEADIFPLVYSFDPEGNPHLRNPCEFIYTTRKEEENLENYLRKANCLVLNDFHNNLDMVKKGKRSLEESLFYLEKAKKFIDEGKPAIIVSESPLNSYALDFNEKGFLYSNEFDNLILEFGQFNPFKDREYKNKAKYWGFIEVDDLGPETADFFMHEVLGVKSFPIYFTLCIDEKCYWGNIFRELEILRNPRSLIKLKNRFPEKDELSFDDLAQLAKEGLKKLPKKDRNTKLKILNSMRISTSGSSPKVSFNEFDWRILEKSSGQHWRAWPPLVSYLLRELFELPITAALYL